MRVISDKKLLRSYIEKYNLRHIFDDALIKDMELFCFDKGEIIFNKGIDLKYMYFLVSGKIKIYMLQDNGKLLLIRLNRPLNVLGDIELLTDYQTQCHVESLDESLCIAIKMSILRETACKDAKFLQYIVKNLSSKLYTISNSAT
ncbi:MAG: cyclic nucleotide-binding domain-containing protein, partial [Clostridia bacterium]|nr:cyclic nucleotide-binding domain-containing protein [Clostridia bacterium]